MASARSPRLVGGSARSCPELSTGWRRRTVAGVVRRVTIASARCRGPCPEQWGRPVPSAAHGGRHHRRRRRTSRPRGEPGAGQARLVRDESRRSTRAGSRRRRWGAHLCGRPPTTRCLGPRASPQTARARREPRITSPRRLPPPRSDPAAREVGGRRGDRAEFAARCLDAEGLVVVVDSALNGERATPHEVERAVAPAPQAVRRLLDRCDAEAQSGTETMVRLRLRARNITVTTQHRVPGVGRVDLLVGERLVIEVDSHAHHTGVERYEADRARDRRLVQLGTSSSGSAITRSSTTGPRPRR